MASAEGKLCCTVLLWAWEVSGCEVWVAAAASPWASAGQGCPDLPIQNHHVVTKCPDTLPGHPLPAHSPSGTVPPVLWNPCEMQGLKWVIHGFRQSWWHLLLKGLHNIFHSKSLFLAASLLAKRICLKLLFYLNFIQNNVIVSESEGSGKYFFYIHTQLGMYIYIYM